ncbi:MAG TPA: sigma 54-interacting transcriptional regulator [Kofleriaceae bacterium]|nr:sigma 54-interacting transcriptional regulator [Kofleriaceae bacterium]
MRVLLLLEPAVAQPIDAALAHRGHRVVLARPGTGHVPDYGAVDLIIADAAAAGRLELVARVGAEAPGVELILIGGKLKTVHPDVIAHVEEPVDLERLLGLVDEVADILDGERFREPIDLVAYETLFAGESPQIRDLLRRVRLVARSEAPVWIIGDDGSGRAVIARAVHDRSGRRTHPFLAFNTAAYSDDELARLLFRGDEAAVRRAQKGTLFLERVGVAGPITQRELVHYLETRGADAASPRLIVGVQSGAEQFISPEVYYRLKVLEIVIPPLKDRARDLEEIVGCMLRRLSANDSEPEIADEAMSALERYAFPGNLLELSHALTHAFVLARGASIEPKHLPVTIRQAADSGRAAVVDTALDGDLEALDVVAKRFERDYLLRVLRSVGGNRGRAAEVLGLSRKGLWGKLKTHGISDADIDDA